MSSLPRVSKPQDYVGELAVIATHRGHLRQWLYGGTEEKCQQVQLAIRVSLWARSKHLLMCDRVWWFDVPWTRWWRDKVRDMVWHYITLTKPSDFLWKIAFECYDGLYQIVLQDSWLVQTATPMMSFIWKEGHFSEIHRSIAQAQRKQISNELFLCLHNPLLRKVLNDFRRYSLCGFTPEFQNQFIIDTHSCWEALLNSYDYIIIEMLDLCTIFW